MWELWVEWNNVGWRWVVIGSQTAEELNEDIASLLEKDAGKFKSFRVISDEADRPGKVA